jgi:putative transposase
MRYSPAEKMEIIRLVEESDQSVRRTLEELGIARSSYYEWYDLYQRHGYEGLAGRRAQPRRLWNEIPEVVREHVVEVALDYPEKSPRELACYLTDTEEYFISESSVYRILKRCDLITSPLFHIASAKDEYEHKTKQVNEMWQTDFTQFKVVLWGKYYLCTVLDDFSRYILAWRLAKTMTTDDVTQTLDIARERIGLVEPITVEHRPRLLSDNGSSFVSGDLADYLNEYKIQHVRGAPYHPQTQGKIERWHRSLKNLVKLELYYFPWHLEQAIASFVTYYNHQRCHESLDNLTPADVYFGRTQEVQARRDSIKQKTLAQRRQGLLPFVTQSVLN